VTCYNLERYIGAAILSALEQDYGGPIEIIVVDDCSTDGSAEIIRSFPETRYLRTERNGGVLLATLQGMAASTGELIFFLDGDDLWEPDKLSACLAAFKRDPRCAIVTHDLEFADGDGVALDRPSRPQAALGPLDDDTRSDKILRGLVRQDDYIWLGSAWGVRRSLARLDEFRAWASGLPDPANTYQDWPLAMWVASLPDVRAAYVPRKLFRYRLHQANYSGDATNAAKAARNFTRTRNTLAAMHALAAERALRPAVIAVLRRRMQACAYLACLYRGNRLEALSLFPAAVAEFRRSRSLGKELVRLGGVQLLGPGLFARLSGFLPHVRNRAYELGP
jgi:glycosyltransferase involved in cell wall biosynthesis